MQAVYNMGLMVESLIQRQVDFNTSTNVTRIFTPVASYFPGTPNGNPYIRKDISIRFQPKQFTTWRGIFRGKERKKKKKKKKSSSRE